MIKTILFATDLGVLTTHSLMHVEGLARGFKAKITIVHAVPPLGELAAAVVRSHCSARVKEEVLQTPHIKGLLESMRAEIFALLSNEPWSDSDFLSLIGDVVVAPGSPAAVILREAERRQADLIVIGSHSSDCLDARLLGSVATKVLQLAKVPVFMVPLMDATALKAPSEWRPLSGSRWS
jgi:nucleotide-binding universal stress UspA family protein